MSSNFYLFILLIYCVYQACSPWSIQKDKNEHKILSAKRSETVITKTTLGLNSTDIMHMLY